MTDEEFARLHKMQREEIAALGITSEDLSADLGSGLEDEMAATIARLEADREKLAQWMITNNYATGHGDTIADLLKELEWQIAQGRARLEAERTAHHEHVKHFLNEMAETLGLMLDPVSTVTIENMCALLLNAARDNREWCSAAQDKIPRLEADNAQLAEECAVWKRRAVLFGKAQTAALAAAQPSTGGE